MAFDEDLADRVRAAFAARVVHYDEKRMMGALCFMVDGKMCVGIVGEQLMVRLDPDEYESALRRKGCAPMDVAGRPMRGFVLVAPAGTESRSDLAAWLERALEFNPRAKATRKRKPKA